MAGRKVNGFVIGRAMAMAMPIGIAVAGIATGCSAKLVKLDATPRHICPGDRVELSWDFDGSGTIQLTPATPEAPDGPVASRGSRVIHPVAPTKVELHVTSGSNTTGGQLEIEMAKPETITAGLADAAAACNDAAAASASAITSTAHVRNFGSGLTVAVIGVRPGDDRGYDVTRVDARSGQPVTAHVAPGAPTRRFAGAPLDGDWVLSSPLPPGATCSAPQQLPGNLVVVAYTQCDGGEGQP